MGLINYYFCPHKRSKYEIKIEPVTDDDDVSTTKTGKHGKHKHKHKHKPSL